VPGRFPAGKVRALPPPEVPFGLWLGRGVTDADLKELAGLKQLHALNFPDPYTHGVTDAGLGRSPRWRSCGRWACKKPGRRTRG
jgi:hypothetical protein